MYLLFSLFVHRASERAREREREIEVEVEVE